MIQKSKNFLVLIFVLVISSSTSWTDTERQNQGEVSFTGYILQVTVLFIGN